MEFVELDKPMLRSFNAEVFATFGMEDLLLTIAILMRLFTPLIGGYWWWSIIVATAVIILVFLLYLRRSKPRD